jgi:hypothetical protein
MVDIQTSDVDAKLETDNLGPWNFVLLELKGMNRF